MKTITIVANEPYHSLSGGIPRFLQEIGPRLSRFLNVQMAVIGNSRKMSIETLNPHFTLYHFPHYALPVGDSYPPRFLKKEMKALIQGSDVVFVQTVDCFIPLYYCKKFKKPLLMYFHGIDWETFPRALGFPWLAKKIVPLVKSYARYWYNRCSCLLVPSATLVPVLEQAKIVSPKHILPLGVDAQQFRPSLNSCYCKERIGLQESDLVLGYTGRLAREKNIDFLLNVFERLQKEFSALKLLLVGSGVKDFEAKIRQNPAVLAVGQKNEVLPYLQAMDVFVMPSQTETSSLSTMEAMASGLPIIAFDVGCLRDYVQNGQNGYLVPLGNEEDFYSKIRHLLQEKELRQNIGREARQGMEVRFNWEDTVRELYEVIEKIVFKVI
ncbi:MAG: glycosyltransferase [Deltaproteobacteria bacterium]|nr:glycosyltransferase [Deltaproteobacteria bacterium]